MSILVGICLLLWCAAGACAETVNRIVAVVNDEIITQADITAFVAAMQNDPEEAAASPGRNPEVERAVLQRLIDQRLMLQEAERAAIVVEPEEVRARYEVFRSRFPSEALFRQSLAQTGISEEQLKQRVRDQLMVQRVIADKVRSTIMVSPYEVSKELGIHPESARAGDRMRVSHLLIRVNDARTESAARALIGRLHQQLAGGADFAALAKQHSEDQHRQEGGAMGWVAPGELMPQLDAALETLQVSQLSDPIQSRLGFHLMRIEERKPASSLSLMEANQAIYSTIYQRKYEEAMARWLGELRKKAYIVINE
ncbi:MAG: peptidylprolyl isomerase [Candidatus Omnitrophica bacterium]|nr:peptidylprolyl isomerase [Candidatus Omnitrophota bacterium]